MKLECLHDRFESAIVKAERASGKNLSLPVLRALLLSAKGSKLTIRATNLDIAIEVAIACKIEKEGTVAVPADVLKALVSHLRGDAKIVLEEKEGKLVVTSSGSNTSIKTLPFDEFPTLPKLGGADETTLGSEVLVQGFRSVLYSAAVSSMKPELSSIYVYYENGHLVFVATDSFRLAEKRIPVEGLNEFPSVLIPAKNVSEIVRMIENESGAVRMQVGDNQAAFMLDSLYITSRTVEGSFPDYHQIVPKSHESSATLLKQDFMNALRVSNIFSDKFNKVTLTLLPGKNALEVKTLNADIGENTSRVEAKTEGVEVEMNFNYTYVFDVFQSILTDSMTISLEAGKPMVVRSVGDTTFMYLVMPMNR